MPKPEFKMPRSVSLRFRTELIGEANVSRILRWYKNNLQLSSIVSKFNSSRLESINKINLCDCYAILYVAYKQNKIQQRKRFLTHELELNTFMQLMRLWKAGEKKQNIISAITIWNQKFSESKTISDSAIIRVFHSLDLRDREEAKISDIKDEIDARELMRIAHVKRINGRRAFVIFHDEMYGILSKKKLKELDDAMDDMERSMEEAEVVEEEMENLTSNKLKHLSQLTSGDIVLERKNIRKTYGDVGENFRSTTLDEDDPAYNIDPLEYNSTLIESENEFVENLDENMVDKELEKVKEEASDSTNDSDNEEQVEKDISQQIQDIL